jgi:hypothetical protein
MAMLHFSPDYVGRMDMLALLAGTLPWQPGYADYAGFVSMLAFSICWLCCLPGYAGYAIWLAMFSMLSDILVMLVGYAGHDGSICWPGWILRCQVGYFV